MNELKCPQCGGNKLQVMDRNIYKCMYCGNIINDQPKQQQPVYQQPQSQPVYQQPQPQPVYQPQPQNIYIQQPRQKRHHRDKITAALLALILGCIGAQEFYLGNTFWGIVNLLFCWTGIPAVWGVIDFIFLLCKSEESFDEEYNY